MPKISKGDDARVIAARSLRALNQANDRLSNDHAFYDDVRAGFSEPSK